MVVVVVVDVVVVVLVVDVVDVVDATARRSAAVVVTAELVPSSRPWNTSADADAMTTQVTTSAPITHPRVLNRPTQCESAPARGSLSEPALAG